MNDTNLGFVCLAGISWYQTSNICHVVSRDANTRSSGIVDVTYYPGPDPGQIMNLKLPLVWLQFLQDLGPEVICQYSTIHLLISTGFDFGQLSTHYACGSVSNLLPGVIC